MVKHDCTGLFLFIYHFFNWMGGFNWGGGGWFNNMIKLEFNQI